MMRSPAFKYRLEPSTPAASRRNGPPLQTPSLADEKSCHDLRRAGNEAPLVRVFLKQHSAGFRIDQNGAFRADTALWILPRLRFPRKGKRQRPQPPPLG